MDLCLLQVHAHPDDEASKAAATAARYAAEGVRTVLVTCTGGEAGEILNPALDTPEVRANLPAVRMRELEEAVAALKYSATHLLGYRDSGMPGTEANADPRNFWNAPVEEATERLVRIIREERPQVIVAYSDDQETYPHPDHLRVHDIAILAFDAAGDPARFPDAGEPFAPLKLYYCGFTMRALKAAHAALLASGRESPYEEWLEKRKDTDHRFTTRIDVGGYLAARAQALAAHATQCPPDSFWFTLTPDEMREIYPWEEFIRARSRVPVPEGETETDLFHGIRG
ncbi:MAG TPA: mycothiol conjugate amidase Mca [Actinomycetota bacterium]|nr:mycothiol conjugate amidase Mca [Actinomycetota bacterium]